MSGETKGGLMNMKLILGGPGSGKTTRAAEIADNLACHQGKKVLYVSVEETAHNLIKRCFGGQLSDKICILYRPDLYARSIDVLYELIRFKKDRLDCVIIDRISSLDNATLQILATFLEADGIEGFVVVTSKSIVQGSAIVVDYEQGKPLGQHIRTYFDSDSQKELNEVREDANQWEKKADELAKELYERNVQLIKLQDQLSEMREENQRYRNAFLQFKKSIERRPQR